MKKSILLCLCFLPLLLNAQFNTLLTVKTLPGVTATKILIPVGFEIQPNPSVGILGEINIPVNSSEANAYDGKAFKVGTQVRYYFNDEKKFRNFWGLEFTHRAERYSKSNDFYYSSSGGEVNYQEANITSVINTVGVHLGGQRVFSNRFVLEWNLGAGIARKSVDYSNVKEQVPTNSGGMGDIFGMGESLNAIFSGLGQGSSSGNTDHFFSSFSDMHEKAGSNVVLFGNLKIGYLLISK
ncbi:MAG: DUF3575 domain-containing protein [Bacteroidetes bacterium]|nr:MAG: DUF3575 domain-containing protein [Bacteroidota bacterium]